VGNIIEVAGTTALDADGNVVGVDDAYAQTRFVLEKIQATLQKAGASLNDVVRTRMFVTNIDRWEEIGKAHGVFFGEIKPAETMVEVNRLIDPRLLIEIEVTAILDNL
jgi:enamine deaminase RidA (YjgF/YER057c/UK114 family)